MQRCYDPDDQRTEALGVTLTVVLHLGTNTLEATPEHPLWVADQGWKAAGQVQVGDELWTRDRQRISVSAIGLKQGQFSVYNFEVEDWHSYFVGQYPLLVHNECKLNYAKAWHDKRATAIFGASPGRSVKTTSATYRHYDKNYKGRDIEFKSDNFGNGPRSPDSLARMNKQIDADAQLRDMGDANPHWHFDHDPRGVADMESILKKLDDNRIPWTFGGNLP